ncbi:MAG: hypothetical protein MZV63_69590 [Marinilabiliales bacterium]|nr:hypothetical protein [Marinilabiliales bacterium]
MITGPIEEARAHMLTEAVELEPYFWVVHNLSAWIYYFEEKYSERALMPALAGLDLNPDFIASKWLLVLNYAKLGEGEKAVKALQQIFSHESLPPVIMLMRLQDAYHKIRD